MDENIDNKYDVLISMAEKDFIKFRFLYSSMINCIEGFNIIHCVTPVPVPYSEPSFIVMPPLGISTS